MCCSRRFFPNGIRTCIRYSTSTTGLSSTSSSETTAPVGDAFHESIKKDRNQTRRKIIIPRKKKRTPTSILEALASTVGKDPTAPKYMYLDDPYLMPSTAISRRNLALAKASGRKAAQYIVNTYSKYFNYKEADPHIEAFMPKPKNYKLKTPTIDALTERINQRQGKDAVQIYELLKETGEVVDADVHQRLLDLLCVYNGEDATEKLMAEEYTFRRDLGLMSPNIYRRTWKNHGQAEKVFEDMKVKTPEAYCSLIRGMAKYLQTDKAMMYYATMKDEKLPVDCATYNAMLYISTFIDETHLAKWQHMQGILKDMKESGTKPTLATFNTVLFSLKRISRYTKAPTYAMQTLNEMKLCGIEPSLASFKYVIDTVYIHENVDSSILSDIIAYLEGKEFTMRDTDDVGFFTNAMAKCYINQKDSEIGQRIDKLVNTGNNHALLGDGHDEPVYYNFYFRLLCVMEDMRTVMEFYDRNVPHIWSPSNQAIDELLKAVELQDGYSYLPRICTDLAMFDFMRRPETLGPVLELMAKKKQEPELAERFSEFADLLMKRWLNEQETNIMRSIELSGDMIANVLKISLNADNFQQAWKVYEIYKAQSQQFTGIPSEESFLRLLDGCILEADIDKALNVLALMHQLQMADVETAAEKIKKEMNLTEAQKQHIDVLHSKYW